MTQDTTVTVVEKPFDPDYYLYQVEHIMRSCKGDYDLAFRRIRLLIMRIYENGVAEGKQDADWYEKSMEARLKA